MTKIVCVGLHRTGTTTFRGCMLHGHNKSHRHVTCSSKGFRLWKDKDYRALLNLLAKYQSCENWPWALFYKHINKGYPESKFVLTTRKDSETWFNSVFRHSKKMGPSYFRKHIYGHEMPDGHKQQHIRFYEKHNESVREYFKDKPGSLLEVCWERGDGWDELSEFIGRERPDVPFPHWNESQEWWGKDAHR